MLTSGLEMILPQEVGGELTRKEFSSLMTGMSVEHVLDNAALNIEMAYRLIAENRDIENSHSYLEHATDQLNTYLLMCPEKSTELLDRMHDRDRMFGHSANVQIMSMLLIYQWNQYRPDQSISPISMGLGAGFHDVGKLCIDPAILQKRGELTPYERREVEYHPMYGYELLEGVADEHVRRLVIYHHFDDGKGYPAGLDPGYFLVGERMLSVIDKYDALRSGRPYKEPMGMGEALTELESMVIRGEVSGPVARDFTRFLKLFTTEGRELLTDQGVWQH
jgi:HD-GYP domain-containing protein (c-di-GMP phosphodiesterase class II)